MDNLRKIEYLLPNWLGHIVDGVIISWDDPRPQPTQAELDAVDMADVLAREIEEDLDRLETNDVIRKLARITWIQENRIRLLEGKTEISWKQFRGALLSTT